MFLTIVNCLFVVTSASWCGSLCTAQSNICNHICGTNYIHELELKNTLLVSEVKRWRYQAALPTTSSDPISMVTNLKVELSNSQVELSTCQSDLSTCQSNLEEYDQFDGCGEGVEGEQEGGVDRFKLFAMVILTFICWM